MIISMAICTTIFAGYTIIYAYKLGYRQAQQDLKAIKPLPPSINA